MKFEKKLRDLLNPETVNETALSSQAALIEKHGGIEVVKNRRGMHGTPVPS